MEKIWNFFYPLIAGPKAIHHSLTYSIGPQKFLKIKRIHFHLFLKSHRK